MSKNLKDLTAIICTLNAERHLENCLENLIAINLKKIIAIDANSTDRTIEILKKKNITIIEDTFKTLGGARSIAVNKVKTKYIFFLGPDNLVDKKMIQKLINTFHEKQWVGVAPQHRIKNHKKYLSKCLNIYKVAKIIPGEANVIGTPQLYITRILKRHNYNPLMHYSDDTELCSRLISKGFKIGISDAISYEYGEDNFKDIYLRWKMYGSSDHDFYELNKKNWSLVRIMLSFYSPLNKDFIQILKSERIFFFEKIYIFPFLIYIVFCRYLGWIKKSFKYASYKKIAK
jgi:GT2 family glycosyltransferase